MMLESIRIQTSTDNISKGSLKRRSRNNFFNEVPAKPDIHLASHSFWSGLIAPCNCSEVQASTMFNELTPAWRISAKMYVRNSQGQRYCDRLIFNPSNNASASACTCAHSTLVCRTNDEFNTTHIEGNV